MSIRVCVAGVTGWTGRAITEAVLSSDHFDLVAAVARSAAGRTVGEALGGGDSSTPVFATVDEALATATDVLIDYTHPAAVKDHVLAAVDAGVGVVVGTSGLGADDYRKIDGAARAAGVGVVAAGNFSMTAALLKHFAGIAARHVRHWEVIDYASAGKPDAPSGTARELAEFLGEISQNELAHAVSDTVGERSARGASIGGAQVHSVRLPSFLISLEAVFGLPDERLTLRHDAGSSADPYVGGTLLAARRVPALVGLTRGLDTLLFG